MICSEYSSGRRAAERGQPRIVPSYIKDHQKWLDGYNSLFGKNVPQDIHKAVKQALDLLQDVKDPVIPKVIEILENVI